MKLKKSLVIITLSFLISPLLLLPISLIYIYNNKFFGYIGLSIFLSILAFTYVPYEGYDLVRHYSVYNGYVNNNTLETVYGYISYNPASSFLYGFIYLIYNLGLKKEFLPAIAVFISTFCFLLMLYRRAKSYSGKARILFVILFVIVFPLLTEASGIRFFLAISIYILYSYFLIIEKRNFYYLIPFFLIIHPVTGVFLIPIFLYKYTIKISRKLMLLSFVLLFSGGAFYIVDISSIAITYILNKTGLFSLGYLDSKSIFDGLTVNQSYSLILQITPFFIVVLFLVLKRKWLDKEAYSFISLFIFTILIFSGIPQFFIRSTFVVNLVFFFYIISFYKEMINGKVKCIIFSCLLVSMFLSSLAIMNTFKASYYPSWKNIYLPTPYLLSITDVNEYIK
ncbi:EpsG family protein [Photobacterium sp. GB-210]|uniref:EpsG family protein n=1 Tax=Photobacterium sp. GB-210 TaxID=2022104 RepID=UPI000D16A2C1|nr:EpsG family protein [Photobacterium sp. GB-210]PSV39780.1 hypothetical protein C9J38_04405 [Photobacterium sp. GB-210]